MWPYVSFLLGTIFALVLQWVSYRLSLRKDREKEYWIRKLNGYQDFHHQMTQLIELLESDVQIPENVFWPSISYARKAAFDAVFYDRAHADRTERMKTITVNLIKLFNTKKYSKQDLDKLHKEVEEIRAEFYLEETSLPKEGA